jgi:hypothetical protein
MRVCDQTVGNVLQRHALPPARSLITNLTRGKEYLLLPHQADR